MKRPRSASDPSVRLRIGGYLISTLERLFTWVASLWLRYLAWQARRALLMALKELDDRTLSDIGLERDEIEVGVDIAFERWATDRSYQSSHRDRAWSPRAATLPGR